ncbi:FAD-dependent oxidoreductase [Chloroflexota bacterium]
MNVISDKIETDSKIAVIGGGPTGSFFAMYLLHYARQQGIQPQVTIFQDKDFSEPGPKGCKGCAGILSMSLVQNLGELDLTIPQEIIQSRIEHYAVHSPYTSISISNPEKGRPIFSVFRGGGPRLSHFEHPTSFDGWLLEQAQNQGVKVENERVSRLYLGKEPKVEYDSQKHDFDLVVLASGVNAKPVRIQGLKYIPPKTQIMALDELNAGVDQVKTRLDNMAHVFLIPHSGLVFGTLVPNGQFVNVSLLSTGKRPISVTDFLNHELVQSVLPGQFERVCGCRPRTQVSAAGNYYANNFVAIGDAAISRLYKDGIGSSLLSARQAAMTVINHGRSRNDFKRYYQPHCRDIGRNNRWGKLLFAINNRTKDSRSFLLAQQRLIGEEQESKTSSRGFTRAAWGMFSGNYRYRNIAGMTLNPASVARVFWAFLREYLSGIRHKERVYPRKLHVGKKRVLILGSGFGGIYSLRHLVRSLNKNENVETTMVSNENFFLFSPLLHEAALGGIETRHIAYPVRSLHWRDRFTFIQADVEKINLGNYTVATSGGTLNYDYLIMALGSIPDTSELHSMKGNTSEANVFTLKTLRDSMLIRNHVIETFERASMDLEPERQKQQLTFIVSGGGYVGIQFVTQLRDLIYRNMVKYYKRIDPANIRIILVEAESKIVSELHTKLGGYIMRHLQTSGIEVRLKTRVTCVWEDRVEINDKEIVPTNTLIWVAGIRANPQIAELDAEKDNLGRVYANEYLEVPGFPGVYAVGDCAHFEDPKSGEPIPPRAHNAVRQAKTVANNILAEIRGQDKKPYIYKLGGEIVSLGETKAVFRFHKLRLYGFLARLIWLAAYSLLATGQYNRIRILSDWTLSFLFGRDTTFLRIKR